VARFSSVSGGHGVRAGGTHDFYPTRPEIVKALLEVEKFRNCVWEPACGAGHIVLELERNGYRVIGSDLHPQGCGRRLDFLGSNVSVPTNVKSIVTNPPFKVARQFILRAIELGIKKHAWLLRLQFAEGGRRWRELFSKTPPARVWLFASRVQVNANFVGSGGGEICWAWWVWEVGSKTTELRWFPPMAPTKFNFHTPFINCGDELI
jgi:hypothetical protein